jgi:hypothetical protein
MMQLQETDFYQLFLVSQFISLFSHSILGVDIWCDPSLELNPWRWYHPRHHHHDDLPQGGAHHQHLQQAQEADHLVQEPAKQK